MLCDQATIIEEMVKSGLYSGKKLKMLEDHFEHLITRETELRRAFYVGDLIIVYQEMKSAGTRH